MPWTCEALTAGASPSVSLLPSWVPRPLRLVMKPGGFDEGQSLDAVVDPGRQDAGGCVARMGGVDGVGRLGVDVAKRFEIVLRDVRS